MNKIYRRLIHNLLVTLFLAVSVGLTSAPALAGGYDNSLKDVTGLKAVFDVSQGSAKVSNLVFWAIKNVYEDKTVQNLPEKTKLAVVFHGPAVKLISTVNDGLKKEEVMEKDKFQATLRQMKKDGVKLEVCLYAAKVMGVDPATIIPEIDRVGNGFISVIGYQTQGYSVVRVP